MRRRVQNEKGAIVALLAIGLPVIIGVFALVVDVGGAHTSRRSMQTAADAAAVAAMQEVRAGNDAGAAAAALEDAARNGYENAGDTQVVVNRPPQYGAKQGNNDYVEVIVRRPSALGFMRALGVGTDVDVDARAVAGLKSGDACVYTLHPTAASSLYANGNTTINLQGCTIFVNSSSSSAARTNGGATISASKIQVVGDYSGNGFQPTPETGVSPVTDPLAALTAPAYSSGCDYTNVSVKKAQPLYPGVYCGGISVSSKGVATLNSGLYVLKGGGLNLQGSGKIYGSGVSFYLTQGGGYSYGPVDFGGNSYAELSAPASGSLKGVLFFQDRAVSSSALNKFHGTTDFKLEGILYFANSDIRFVGNSQSTSSKTLIVARTLDIRGTADFASLGSSLSHPALSVARLVE